MINRTSVQALARYREHPASSARLILPGLLAVLAAAPLALAIYYIHSVLPQQPERAVQWVGVMFLAILVLTIGTYVAIQRGESNPLTLGLIVLATVSVLLVAVYLYWVSFYVFFPADTLIWSEGDFVNDIIKFRAGYPLYSAQQNNESFVYGPGSRVVTYCLAWLSGNSLSIPVYRLFQVLFTLLAAVVSVCSFLTISRIALVPREFVGKSSWGVFTLPFFLLLASNAITNPFVHNLHDDALAQLLTVSGFYLLLRYSVARRFYLLVLMVLLPAVGFLVKQTLAIWAAFYCGYLLLFDQPRSYARLITFVAAVTMGLALVVMGSYLFWGDHFVYWMFTVMASHRVSPLRSFQHLLDGWPYLFIGLLGGLVLLRGEARSRLLGVWLVWLSLLLIETYTSGVAWMHNHMGPGSLIGGIWFIAGIAKLTSHLTASEQRVTWLRTGIAVAAVTLLFNGLGVVRIPVRPISEDAYRYVREIEKEFQGQTLRETLLDMGSWVYLENGVIMKDRAPSIGERGYSETGNFSGILSRIGERRYAKILLRNFHSLDFLYDHQLWPKSSGIRQALVENYNETGRILAVQDESHSQGHHSYLFGDISILTPKSN